MKKIDICDKIYKGSSTFGSRVSKRSLNDAFHDPAFVDEAIAKLFVECPTKFPGESKYEKHYLLKPFWQIYKEFLEVVDICNDPRITKKWPYIKQLIDDNLFFWSDWRWYMHPTAISRHGRFFINPKINF